MIAILVKSVVIDIAKPAITTNIMSKMYCEKSILNRMSNAGFAKKYVAMQMKIVHRDVMSIIFLIYRLTTLNSWRL